MINRGGVENGQKDRQGYFLLNGSFLLSGSEEQ